ncbi:hypothetical protein WMY93_033202 [Mugilogobius chulae]|uniref:Uncharacterized protein n=1 Tax=Mugilogobius chulae TaxID=88201 RepID=A0AAW0MLT7_9GOBI
MERVSVLCVLLLLLCSPSGAELQDNEISEQRQAGPESVNVPEQPQPCPSDLHAVLRDMSAALAEHRVRIQQLQDVNQAQAAELRELKTRDVESLKQQQQGQAAELNSLKIQTNVTENHVASLRRDRTGAELQDNEISEQRQAGPESVNVPEQPQPCPSDLHAVLRDMSAALAEHRVRIQQLQDVNQDLHAVLRDMSAALAEHRVRIQQLQDVNQEQAAKLTELEFKTRDMESQQQGLTAQVKELEKQTSEVEPIKEKLRVSKSNHVFLELICAPRQVNAAYEPHPFLRCMACQSYVLLLHPAQSLLTGKTQPSPFEKLALPISVQSGRSKSPTLRTYSRSAKTQS